MATERLTLSLAPATALSRLTADERDLQVWGYPLDGGVLLRCRGRVRAFAQRLAQEGHHVDAPTGDGLDVVVPDAWAAGDVLATVKAHGAAVLPPVTWERGEMRLDVLLLNGTDAATLASKLPKARLEARRGVSTLDGRRGAGTSDLFLHELTGKQARALVTALESGYYDAPRGVTTAELAGSLGLARSTFEEHLKRAESQVVRALAPVARLRALANEPDANGHARAARAAGDALEAYARFSRELGLWVHLLMRDGRVAALRLDDRPPEAQFQRDHAYMARVLQHLTTGHEDLSDIPLDLDVSPFTRQVLEAMRKVPPGKTLTYGELAEIVGHPRAARAVGSACAKNPVPIIVPCHRIVPKAGGVGQYGAGHGPETKEWLLAREASKKSQARQRS